MEPLISFIYANRNRDLKRIQLSFTSLENQNKKNFEVIFVDYGSDPDLVKQYCTLKNSFVTTFFLPVSQLLWNKSKALNFGIKKAVSPYIFIADVDLVFHPETTLLLEKIRSPRKFFLFNLGYLGRKESMKITQDNKFQDLQVDRIGAVNGMVFSSKEALFRVNGLDEFFHFYGAEDEDLFARLENAGYERLNLKEQFFYHNWHKSFAGSEDRLLTGNPRVKNIMRINQRHFQWNRNNGVVKPINQQVMGEIIAPERAESLNFPTVELNIKNIQAHLEHFLKIELPSHKGEIVHVQFEEDTFYSSFKHEVKKKIGRQTQPYCSMKEVNDMVLKEILYNYRDFNYSYAVKEDLKTILFKIEL